jgi:hypothetical protein
MKRNVKMISYGVALLLAASMALNADEAPKPKKGSTEFERMKTLVGTWQGKTDIGQGPIDITVKYRVVAGGNVLEERVFEGTPYEMTTMYYDQDGKLAATHYCVIGNRPGMLLKSSDEKSIKLDFDKTCGLNTKEDHMHGMTIKFDDADTITTSCKAFKDGKEVPDHATTLKRVKA